VRLKGIPEGVIFLSFNITKTLINKGLYVIARNEAISYLCIYLSFLLQQESSSLFCHPYPDKDRESNLYSQVGQAYHLLFYKNLERVT